MRTYFILVCMLVLSLLGCEENFNSWPTVEFEKAKWASAAEEKRFIYSRDLIASKRLNGLSRQEVVELLGPPSFSDNNVNYITYILKISSGNIFLLDIRFKEKSDKLVVAEVFVRPD